MPNSQYFAINSFLSAYLLCLNSTPVSIIFTVYTVVFILFHLPLSALVLYRLSQKSKSCSSLSATRSHSDCFTYNMVILQSIACVGYSLDLCGIYKESVPLLKAGTLVSTVSWFGETFFHILTCLERYLAVVHPIAYLRLKKDRGVRLRNIITVCVWLLCLVGTESLALNIFTVVNFCLLLSSLPVMSFCSISVLCVLIHSGPRYQGDGRERVDQSKQRAFFTIVVIMVLLLLRFTWGLFWAVLEAIQGSTDCVTMTFDLWVNLPSTLALQLLFLHRAGKFVCCRKNHPISTVSGLRVL